MHKKANENWTGVAGIDEHNKKQKWNVKGRS
jgi:hypothetical protein